MANREMMHYVRPYPYRVTAKFESGKASIHEDNTVEALDTTELADNLLLQGWDWQKEVIPVLKEVDAVVRKYADEMWRKEISLKSANL